MNERIRIEIGLAAGRAKKAAEELRDTRERLHGWAAGNPYWPHAAGKALEAAKLRERKALRALDKLCAQHVTADADDVEDLAALPRLPVVGRARSVPPLPPHVAAAQPAGGAA